MNTSSLFNLSWPRYLNLLFLLLSAGFLTSGIVTLIAANLDYFSDLAKIYGLQAVLLLSIALGFYFFLRESRKLEKEKLKLLSATFFFITSVLIGAVFALVGQIYQTGANAWELFAIWSVCQLPLLLLLPNVASALLLVATTNIALFLFNDSSYENDVALSAVSLNFIFLLLSELFIHRLHDGNWRLLPKFLVFLTLVNLFFVRILTDFLGNDVDSSVYFFILFLQVALPSLACICFYKQYRIDFMNLITATVSLITAFGFFLFSNVNSADFAVLSGLLLFIITIGAIMLLHGWYKRHYPERKSISWALSILLIFAIFIGIVTGLIWIFLALNVSDPRMSLLVLSVIVLFIALGMHFGNPDAESHISIIIGIFFLMGYCLLGGYFLSDVFDRYDSGTLTITTPLLFTVVVGIFYFLRKEIWLRTLTIMIVLVMWHIYFSDFYFIGLDYANQVEYHYVPFYIVTMLGCVVAFLTQKVYSENEKISAQISPFAWAFLLFSICASLQNAGYILVGFSQMADELPKVMSFAELFDVVTAGVFTHADFVLGWIIPFLVGLTPLVIFLVIRRLFVLDRAETILISLAFSLFIIGFISQPSILFLVTLLLLAYLMDSRMLFFIAVFFLTVNLGLYYYSLTIPLLYKALLLLLFAFIFSGMAIYLLRKYKPQTQSAVGFANVSKVKPLVALAVVLLILIPLNYKVQQFEDVLATGKPVVLKIVPVDPRSLMQGDYMSLSYAILNDIRAKLDKPEDGVFTIETEKKRPSKVYALIHQDEQGVATLCRVEDSLPNDFKDCAADVYLPVNNFKWLPELPSQEYFFAEGKGQHYAQAEYAEYRFKNGILLLARLLDKDLKAL
ncbi:GDYXXLXY domain-containing protein [Aggregatibacter aphrophilus]|uniref:Beta-carotene 15,15'-monooxygenase n=1 Tax=Aggregatibacter aphrophilus TaxID=732 RepID=A0AAP7GWF6_AGGAP|nr:GDYXXLXY domain-containing protein [Aggregatibacter aphrophilus]OBY51960.1 beta-carotene 15,15'-monooxygenase [Aggregatibacter aphrophilus]